jgi:N-acyl-D-aspartate/D-glutamate deacylase
VLAQSGTVITNIQLIDGTGKPAYNASVRIVGNKIVAIGNLKEENFNLNCVTEQLEACVLTSI